MANKNDAFLKKLIATFRIEADEHLQAMSSGLLALEKMPDGEQRAERVEKIFREAHSLKGAARAVGFTAIESLCQSMENVFAALKNKQLAVSPPLFDLLQQGVDVIGGILAAEASPSQAYTPAATALMRRLDEALTGKLPASETPETPAPPAAAPEPAAPEAQSASADEAPAKPAATAAPHTPPSVSIPAPETIRVSTAKLDSVMRQVEELLSPRLAAKQRAREMREIAAALSVWKKQRTRIQPALRRLERLSERSRKANGGAQEDLECSMLFEYLDAEQLHMKTLEDQLTKLNQSAEHDQRILAAITDNLLNDVKAMQLLPFASLLDILPRIARELARDQGKGVELQIQGSEIEIDRRILEEMKDPLIHLLRNAIDHGIEPAAAREAKGKPARGTITLSVSQQDGGKVELLMADDGAGIDAARVKAAAGKLGAISAEEAERLGEPEAQALIFQSGISTSSIITDISGRGLGLAIVREKVERLGGTVTLKSQPNTGTRFRISLPLTLANFRGVLVRSGGQLFVIPSASVERVMRMTDRDIQTVENRETIPLDGQAVSLVWLSDALELPPQRPTGESTGTVSAVILGSGHARIGFRVDEILGDQEVLVKTLGPQLARVRNVGGASVLGTGQVVPVLNVPDLLKSAVKGAAAQHATASAESPGVAGKQSILIAEDSITSRTLLKNILELAGYQVTATVDGADAYATLKSGVFDLLVSDVEMPRMDGFDLTAKVRADKKLAELPVVLVTALGSREHRERGIDAGANAYIVKSSFDQGNLLEIIRRLI